MYVCYLTYNIYSIYNAKLKMYSLIVNRTVTVIRLCPMLLNTHLCYNCVSITKAVMNIHRAWHVIRKEHSV